MFSNSKFLLLMSFISIWAFVKINLIEQLSRMPNLIKVTFFDKLTINSDLGVEFSSLSNYD